MLRYPVLYGFAQDESGAMHRRRLFRPSPRERMLVQFPLHPLLQEGQHGRFGRRQTGQVVTQLVFRVPFQDFDERTILVSIENRGMNVTLQANVQVSNSDSACVSSACKRSYKPLHGHASSRRSKISCNLSADHRALRLTL